MTAKGNGSPNARRHSLAKLWGSPHPTCAAQLAEPCDDKKFFVRASREGDSQRTALGQKWVWHLAAFFASLHSKRQEIDDKLPSNSS